jgi:hypothetical protein
MTGYASMVEPMYASARNLCGSGQLGCHQARASSASDALFSRGARFVPTHNPYSMGIIRVQRHCHAGGPKTGEIGVMTPPLDPHYRHRFPAEVISHTV